MFSGLIVYDKIGATEVDCPKSSSASMLSFKYDQSKTYLTPINAHQPSY